MRRLFLHIGNNKTGTTSIQENLLRLASGDPRILNKFPNNSSQKNTMTGWAGNHWIKPRLPLDGRGLRFREGFAQALIAHNPDGDVIFSSEALSWVFHADILAPFADEMKAHFDQVKILVYLRRQDRNAFALAQQAMKSARGFTRAFIFPEDGQFPELQPHHYLYFDYYRRMEIWAHCFGREAIMVRNFDAVTYGSDGLLRNAFHALEIDAPPVAIRRNKGLSKVDQTLLWRAGLVGFDPKTVKDLQIVDIAGTPHYPRRDRAQQFYAAFAASNDALFDAYFAPQGQPRFDDDFSRYPKNKEMRYTADEVHAVIDKLLLLLADACHGAD